MVLTLKERIAIAHLAVDIATRKLDVETAELRELVAARVYCLHTFEPADKGYEHEGGHCSKCGINELYAHTLASWQKTA